MRLTDSPAPASWRAASREVALDLIICLRFYSRLPLRPLPFEPKAWDAARLGPALRLAPLAGAVIGAIGSAILALCGPILGLPPWVAATLAIAGLISVGGALHEDGLADAADGFGGGADRQRKLDIMRDSRIGTFGALALILSVVLRVGALAGVIERFGYMGGMAALVAAGAASRGFGLWPLATLPPARADGLGHAAGLVPRSALLCALVLATLLATVSLALAGLSAGRALLACLMALGTGVSMARMARRQIGGHTGDVAGAAQQLSEISFLLALLLAPRLG